MRIRIKERNRKKKKKRSGCWKREYIYGRPLFPSQNGKRFFYFLSFCGKRCAVGVKSDSVGTGGVSAVVDVEPTGRFSFSLS
jgi:hypothetical protein